MLTTCDSSINSNRANNVKQCNYNEQLIQWVIVNSVFHGVNVKGFFLLLHLRVLLIPFILCVYNNAIKCDEKPATFCVCLKVVILILM